MEGTIKIAQVSYNNKRKSWAGFADENSVLQIDKKDAEKFKMRPGDRYKMKIISSFKSPKSKWRICKVEVLEKVENPNKAKEIPSLELSELQRKIVDFAQNDSANGVIEATAGAGKTTTLLQVVKALPKDVSILYLAFNRAIVEEMKNRVPDKYTNVEIVTSHGYGKKAIENSTKSGNTVEVDKDKYGKIIDRMNKDWKFDDDVFDKYKADLLKIIGMLMATMTNHLDENAIEKMCSDYEFDCYDNTPAHVRQCVEIGLNERRTINFDEMLWLPAMFADRMRWVKYDFVLIDECQDLNAAQHIIYKNALKADGRFIAVGDSNQSIYAFRGADVRSFKKFIEVENTKQLDLSVTRRCGKKIVEYAKSIIPEAKIEAMEDAHDGEVLFSSSIKEVKKGDMILCRKNAPLIDALLKLIKLEVNAAIRDKDFGKRLYWKLKGTNKKDYASAISQLRREFNEKYEKKSKETKKYETDLDILECIETLCFDCESVSDATTKISKYFVEAIDDGVLLSTVHKAKGLEAERVFLLGDGLDTAKKRDKDWEQEQEWNMIYVAITRAISRLAYLTDLSIEEKDNEEKETETETNE